MHRFDIRHACVRRALQSASVLAFGAMFTLAAAEAALAQPAPPADKSEVVVTGSRIVRNGYTAPTPLTVVGGRRRLRQGGFGGSQGEHCAQGQHAGALQGAADARVADIQSVH